MKIPALLIALIIAGSAGAQESVELSPELQHGKRIFRLCKACHMTSEDGRHLSGPNLHGLFDRPAASAAGYPDYSVALRSSGITWDPETLDAWLSNPNGFLPGNRMSFTGVPASRDRQALIAWLQYITSPSADKDGN